jgi:ferredoxin
METVYEDLAKALPRAGGAIPAIPIPELYELLQELVTPEEAAVATTLTDGWTSAREEAKRLGRPEEEIAPMLENITGKGILHARRNGEGLYEYRLMPLLPGIYEMQFYRGTKTERDYRIARLFKDYLETLGKMRDSLPQPPPVPKTSYFRVLPVEKEVSASTVVLPYAIVSRYVEETEAIAVGTCFCRHHAVLLDEKDNCGASHQNCLAFGEGAIFVADRKFGHLISKEEARRILQKAEEEGLVHCSANTSEELAFICNCCTCHCGILSQAKRFPQSSLVLTSGYHAQVDPDRCTACEICKERCPIGAIQVEDSASVDSMKCIGCGLCVNTCPSEAMGFVVRANAATPPGSFKELEVAIKQV